MKVMKKRMLSVFIIVSMVLTLSGSTGNVAQAADVLDTASLLSMNGQWSGNYWLTDDEDAHYYKIVIPADGRFSFKIMSYIDRWCDYDLYSGDMSEHYWDSYVSGGTETSPQTKSRWTDLSKGTYILKIYSDGGYTGKYRLQCSYKNHHVNDANAVSYDSPQNFALGSTITGALTESDREDWYRIRVSKTGYYTFFCKNYVDNSFYYKLYSSDLLNVILDCSMYGADETEPKTEQNDIVLKAGTYYIKVTGSSNATGRYTLKWDSLKKSNCDHSYKEKRVYPTYTRRGYTLHKCEKCGKSYKDNYSPKKKLGNVSGYVVVMRKKIKLTWYTVEDASGYQIRYSTNKKMKKSVKTVTLKGKRKTKKTIKKLRSGKSYFFQVRAYRNEGKKKIYGRWSSKRKVRVG